MSWVRTLLIFTLLGSALPVAVGTATAAPAKPVLTDAGDEATLAARRSDLVLRLAEAERGGTLSAAEAARHRSALDTMIASARRDIARPPHFISAAENATYRRTIANVEEALSKHGKGNADRSTWGLIVTYRPGDERVHRRLLAHTKAAGLSLGYNLPRMSRITVNGNGEHTRTATIAAYRKIPGVLSVDRDEASALQSTPVGKARDTGPE